MNFRLFFILTICALYSFALHAETLFLKDNSLIKGTILSFYEDKFVVSLESGGKETVEKSKVDKIVFDSANTKLEAKPLQKSITTKSPNPSLQFESPIKTFLYWKNAAEKGDLEKMSECFITPARDDQLAQLKSFSKEKVKEMRKETKKTEFAFGEPLIDGDKAYLSVIRKRGQTQRTEIIQFQKEKENWKMLPE